MQETKNYKQLHFEQKQVINVPQNLNLSLGNERIGETELWFEEETQNSEKEQ